MKISAKSHFKLTVILVFALFVSMHHVQADTPLIPTYASQTSNDASDKKKKDEFKIYGGVTFNNLSVESNTYTSVISPGFMLGADYKRGKFFYWQVGARYNNFVYDLTDATIPTDSANLMDGVFSVKSVEVPVTVGLNFLSFISEIVGLRLFVGATPSFAIGVGDNDLNISKNTVNSFNLFGQAGLGVDVLFLYLESGVNYGFMDAFQNDIQSKPVQVFVNLGFRF